MQSTRTASLRPTPLDLLLRAEGMPLVDSGTGGLLLAMAKRGDRGVAQFKLLSRTSEGNSVIARPPQHTVILPPLDGYQALSALFSGVLPAAK
ncbi:hypothetical protein [Roseovarius mucosus]|uniref:hypothetical protein n=1 Tax=Roseovarius mucosus TaxID=215743 RepID=UPI003F6F9ADE